MTAAIMYHMVRKILLTLLLVFPVLSFADEGRGNLEAVLNAFLASIAKDHPEYKADIRLWQAGDPVAPGFQVGQSAALGSYTFRPKTWGELSDAEKTGVLANPRLKSFIVSLRNARLYPAVSAANPDDADRPPGWFPVEGAPEARPEYRVKISPEEMVRNRPVVIPVLPSAAKD